MNPIQYIVITNNGENTPCTMLSGIFIPIEKSEDDAVRDHEDLHERIFLSVPVFNSLEEVTKAIHHSDTLRLLGTEGFLYRFPVIAVPLCSPQTISHEQSK